MLSVCVSTKKTHDSNWQFSPLLMCDDMFIIVESMDFG